MDILAQSALVVAITSISLGFSVLARNVKNKLFLAFSVLAVWVGGWALLFFLEKVFGGGAYYRWHLFFNIWLGTISLIFIRIMLRVRDSFSQRILNISILGALLLSGALLLTVVESGLILQLIYFAPIVIVIQVTHLMVIDRHLKRGFKRLPKVPTVGLGRRNLIYFGALFVLCTSVMDHLPWLGKFVPSLGNVALAIYLFFLSQAITQQRLLNFSALFTRFLVLLAVALMLSGLYSLSILWAEGSPGLFFLSSFMASFLLLMLLDPLRSLMAYFTHRLLTQEHLRLQQTLREAQRKLTGIVDLGSFFQAVVTTSEQVLQPQWAALFILAADGTKYRRVRAVGEEPSGEPPLRQILANHPLLQHCEVLKKRSDLPVLLDQIIENEIDRSASRVQREHLTALIQGLKALGSNLLIPLYDSETMLGFVTMHVAGPPEPWGNNWGLLPIVFPYYEQAAQTLRSMEVYVRQREKERLAALGEMAAGLAHEIRNPLGAIKGAAQYLDPSADRPESKFLKVIVEEVDRLNRVVTQFLDYSKSPALDMKVADVSQLVEKTVELLRPSVKPEITLEFTPASAPTSVLCASEQIQQVILNLLQNSLKSVDGKPQGRIQVKIEVEGEAKFKEVNVTVEDNGKGIKREHLDKLFIPFFTTSPSGTGLGLSICQKIVEDHRGRIEVASEEGHFARFSVILPYAKENA